MRYSDFIAPLVYRLSKRMDKYTEKYLTENTKLSLLDWRLLVHVYKYQNSMLYEIADIMGMPLHEVVCSYLDLKNLELVEISEGEITVYPTENGNKIYAELLPKISQIQEDILSVISKEEREIFKSIIGKLLPHLNKLNEHE
ncbi:MarR family winged helix-turn-helix transcriptional regulator [Hoeflea sp.]|uniref:MarR family winged helix-turn-helix transcriptional regulator n=1 Tax=Hoeflea sp. TaxID=1940281 RepID=UPI003A8DDD48